MQEVSIDVKEQDKVLRARSYFIPLCPRQMHNLIKLRSPKFILLISFTIVLFYACPLPPKVQKVLIEETRPEKNPRRKSGGDLTFRARRDAPGRSDPPDAAHMAVDSSVTVVTH